MLWAACILLRKQGLWRCCFIGHQILVEVPLKPLKLILVTFTLYHLHFKTATTRKRFRHLTFFFSFLFFFFKPSWVPFSIFRCLKLDCKEEQGNRNWCGLPGPATDSFCCSYAVYLCDMQEQDWKACLWVYLCMFALNCNTQEKSCCVATEKMFSWGLHWSSCFFRNKTWTVCTASA